MGLFKKKKKELVAGISIKTVGKTVYLDFDEKMIIKAGTISVSYNNETPDVSLFDWNIGHKKEKKWWMFFRKRGCGVSIEGGSVIISGESPDVIEVTEGLVGKVPEKDEQRKLTAKEFWKNRVPKRESE